MALPAKLLVGVIGNVTSLALYLSPMATFWRIYKLKSTQEYSGYPYVFTLFNCALGLLYGSPFVKPHSTMILTINGAGFVLETFYLLSFLTFASPKNKVRTIKLTCGLMMAFAIEAAITVSVLHTYRLRQAVVGSVGIILSIVMYASPLSVVKIVIKTKSVEFMPFLLSLFNFLNAVAWVAYAIVTRDLFVGVPSAIGSVLGMIQLTVYFMYRNSEITVSPATTKEISESKELDMIAVILTQLPKMEAEISNFVTVASIVAPIDRTIAKMEAEISNFVTAASIVAPIDRTIADIV